MVQFNVEEQLYQEKKLTVVNNSMHMQTLCQLIKLMMSHLCVYACFFTMVFHILYFIYLFIRHLPLQRKQLRAPKRQKIIKSF